MIIKIVEMSPVFRTNAVMIFIGKSQIQVDVWNVRAIIG